MVGDGHVLSSNSNCSSHNSKKTKDNKNKKKKKKKRGGSKKKMTPEQTLAFKSVSEWVFLDHPSTSSSSSSLSFSSAASLLVDDFGVQKSLGKGGEKMVFDLHSHSKCSDGFLSPTKLVEKAHVNGVKVLALTDHDTMAGIPEALEAARRFGIKIIPGVEISTIFSPSEQSELDEPVHILAYYSSCGPKRIEQLEMFLANIRDGRFLRAKNMVSKLNKLNLPIKWEHVARIAGKGVAPGRVHVARAMLEAGYVENLKQAFARYLFDGGPAYSTGSEPPAEEAIQLICNTGGVAVLAHPWALKNPVAVIRRLKEAGLHGMEVYRSDGKLAVYSDLADVHGLLKLGGSDYHGRGGNSESELGSVNLPVVAVHDFLKLARPIWCDAIRDIFVEPQKIFEFYNDLHSYLASCSVDGVKVDVQNLIETLGSGVGGRVSLTRCYQEALEQSIARNFKDNNLICCMSHNSDSIYSSKKSAVARASEDFMPREPTFQTLHIASVAFNSLLLGEIVVPDWDMFHSKHDTAEFHAAARAIGGCAIYVSDKPSKQDFKILRKLVLPDGSVLRARYAGRPSRDCLFVDPVMDKKSMLKIWNLNKLSGVMGVFNCQGAGSWPLKEVAQDICNATSTSSSISCHVSPHDVEFLEEVADESWNGDCAIYAFNSGSLNKLPRKGSLEVSLKTLTCELYTISPIRVFGNDLLFAPLGLLDMYNSGGAVESLNCTKDLSSCKIKIKGRGCGRFGAYSSTKPKCCMVNMKKEEFTYNAEDGLLTVKIQGELKLGDIEFVY